MLALHTALMTILAAAAAPAPACAPAPAEIEVVQSGAARKVDLRPIFAHAAQVTNAAKDGSRHDYAAVPLSEVLAAADAPLGDTLRGKAVGLTLLARARDGYVASFALAEIDASIGARAVWLAACKDGAPLDAQEGPLRLLVPDDRRPARALRQLQQLRIVAP